MCKNILFYLQLWFEREAAVEHANVCISATMSSPKFLGFFVPSFTFDQQNIDLILVLPNLAWNRIQISYLLRMGYIWACWCKTTQKSRKMQFLIPHFNCPYLCGTIFNCSRLQFVFASSDSVWIKSTPNAFH